MFMLFTEARITCPKRYAEKGYIRETAQTPSAEPLYTMKKTTTIIDEVGLFSLFEYCTSHNQFLFRSHDSELKENSDILFSDVEYLDLPLCFSNPKIYVGNEECRTEILEKFDLKKHQKVIIIEEDGRKYVELPLTYFSKRIHSTSKRRACQSNESSH